VKLGVNPLFFLDFLNFGNHCKYLSLQGLAWPYYLQNLNQLRSLQSPIQYMDGAQSLQANFCTILNIICQRMLLEQPPTTATTAGQHHKKCG
jgi:hypothetical protein